MISIAKTKLPNLLKRIKQTTEDIIKKNPDIVTEFN